MCVPTRSNSIFVVPPVVVALIIQSASQAPIHEADGQLVQTVGHLQAFIVIEYLGSSLPASFGLRSVCIGSDYLQ